MEARASVPEGKEDGIERFLLFTIQISPIVDVADMILSFAGSGGVGVAKRIPPGEGESIRIPRIESFMFPLFWTLV